MGRSTARDLITNAYRICGGKAIIESPESEEGVFALDQLNSLIEDQGQENLFAPSESVTTGELSAGITEYTIISNGDFNVTRPQEIVSLQIQEGSVWYNLDQKSPTDFYQSSRNTSQGQPYLFYYDKTYPTSKINVYPTPSKDYDARVVTRDSIATLTLNTVLNLRPGYFGYLEVALAAILAPILGIPNPSLQQQAEKRLARLKRQNFQGRTLKVNFGKKRHYDINGDRSW